MRTLGLVAFVSASLLLTGLALAEGRVYDSPETVQPLPVGSAVPSVEVRTVEGATVDLARAVREAGALLVFYRGGW